MLCNDNKHMFVTNKKTKKLFILCVNIMDIDSVIKNYNNKTAKLQVDNNNSKCSLTSLITEVMRTLGFFSSWQTVRKLEDTLKSSRASGWKYCRTDFSERPIFSSVNVSVDREGEERREIEREREREREM